VSTLLMKPDDKTIDKFVVSSGGILGIGSHLVAMPVDGFSWDADNGGFKIAKRPMTSNRWRSGTHP
jgi:hypothetical protein